MSPESLYEEDFYAWTQQQAELLRRLPTAGNEIDLEHIAEEIEDLGRSDLRTARSLCQHIIEHLLKLEYSGLDEPADHWRDEIVEWRLRLEQILTPEHRSKTRSARAVQDSVEASAPARTRRPRADEPPAALVPLHPRTNRRRW